VSRAPVDIDAVGGRTQFVMIRAETEKIREQKRQRLVVKFKEQQAAQARHDARQAAQRELFRYACLDILADSLCLGKLCPVMLHLALA